jgi:hypothetical protein
VEVPSKTCIYSRKLIRRGVRSSGQSVKVLNETSRYVKVPSKTDISDGKLTRRGLWNNR